MSSDTPEDDLRRERWRSAQLEADLVSARERASDLERRLTSAHEYATHVVAQRTRVQADLAEARERAARLAEILEEMTDTYHDTVHGVEDSVERMRACTKSPCSDARAALAADRQPQPEANVCPQCLHDEHPSLCHSRVAGTLPTRDTPCGCDLMTDPQPEVGATEQDDPGVPVCHDCGGPHLTSMRLAGTDRWAVQCADCRHVFSLE